MAFVEAPVLLDGQPQPPHRLEREMEGLDRARLQAGEAEVEVEPLRRHQLARAAGLLDALGGEVDVPPAGEAILEVPLRLAVPQEHERWHQASTFSAGAFCVVAACSSGRIAWSASRQAKARYFERCGDQP
jgi:hypothetical protein